MTDKEKLIQIEYLISEFDNENIAEEVLIDFIRETLTGKVINLEPETDPECTASPEEQEESGIECEFDKKDGGWWCTTHNCHA
jgi:hypothetical protein